jgi:hypothetical protein
LTQKPHKPVKGQELTHDPLNRESLDFLTTLQNAELAAPTVHHEGHRLVGQVLINVIEYTVHADAPVALDLAHERLALDLV